MSTDAGSSEAAATYLDVDAVLARPGEAPAGPAARIAMREGRIVAIEPAAARGGGDVALAAFANAHDHGRGLRTLAFGAFDDALEAWIPTLGREPRVSPYHRAVVAFARMAEGGIAVANHSHGYQDESAALQEAEAVARAAADVGIRVAFAAPFRDRNFLAYGDEPTFLAAAPPALRARLGKAPREIPDVRDYLRQVDAIASFESPWFHVQYCPVGAQWASDAALAAIAEASALSGRRIHMHLLETRYQREWADHAYPSGMIAAFDRLGLLSPRLSVAHGVYLRRDECELLAERGVTVSVNTVSNLRLRSGTAPVADFLAAGVRFGLGLDAHALEDDDDFFREMRLFWLNQRGLGLEDSLEPARVFRAAQIDGRFAVLGDDGGGRLGPGAPADILTIDYAGFTRDILTPAAPAHVAHLLQRATRRSLKRMIVAGRPVVEDGRCVSVDLPALEAELYAQARTVWRAAPPDDAAGAEMRKAVRNYYGCGCHMGRPLSAS